MKVEQKIRALIDKHETIGDQIRSWEIDSKEALIRQNIIMNQIRNIVQEVLDKWTK